MSRNRGIRVRVKEREGRWSQLTFYEGLFRGQTKGPSGRPCYTLSCVLPHSLVDWFTFLWVYRPHVKGRSKRVVDDFRGDLWVTFQGWPLTFRGSHRNSTPKWEGRLGVHSSYELRFSTLTGTVNPGRPPGPQVELDWRVGGRRWDSRWGRRLLSVLFALSLTGNPL